MKKVSENSESFKINLVELENIIQKLNEIHNEITSSKVHTEEQTNKLIIELHDLAFKKEEIFQKSIKEHSNKRNKLKINLFIEMILCLLILIPIIPTLPISIVIIISIWKTEKKIKDLTDCNAINHDIIECGNEINTRISNYTNILFERTFATEFKKIANKRGKDIQVTNYNDLNNKITKANDYINMLFDNQIKIGDIPEEYQNLIELILEHELNLPGEKLDVLLAKAKEKITKERNSRNLSL